MYSRRLKQFDRLRVWKEERDARLRKEAEDPPEIPSNPGEKTDWPYNQFEAARWWGYTLGQWRAADAVERSEVIAHWLEYDDREKFREYDTERRKKMIKAEQEHFKKPGWAKYG